MRDPASASAVGHSPRAGQSRRSCLVVVPLIGGVFLLLVAVALILFLGLRQVFRQEEANPGGMPLEVVKVTPVVVPTATVAPLPTPPHFEECETIVGSEDVEVALSLPVSLTVKEESFPVVPILFEDGGWTYPEGYPGIAAWICGTVVNYVVGLEPKPENEALLADLRPGDELKMHLSNGAVFFFRFTERREATAGDGRVFAQSQPQLTLLLEQENGIWQVATADYVSETEPVQPPVGSLTSPGQPVRVGDTQVTVARGHVVRGGADLSSGTMYYLVEFSVENVGTASLDVAVFSTQLQDDLGNSYLPSSEASAAGEYGPLSGEIEPGTIVQGTAGYLVPETLVGPALIWTFTPQPGSESRASVSIPYEPDTEPSSPAQAEVKVDEDGTFLSSSGDLLIITGEVRNTGGEPLTVELGDISLTSSAGMSALQVAAPPLPWTIQPGQAQMVELQYDKPDAATALLTLLGYSFEIRGLR
jgi:hypothetical protein